jgi:hypothetical protein
MIIVRFRARVLKINANIYHIRMRRKSMYVLHKK